MTVVTPSLRCSDRTPSVLPGWFNHSYDTLAVHADCVLGGRCPVELYVALPVRRRVRSLNPRDVLPEVVFGLPGVALRGWAWAWTYHLALGWPVEGDL